MSPRAAWRLESLGFARVYDYLPGKADWFAAGLPRAGSRAGIRRVGDVARGDDVTCRLGERLGAVAERVRAAGRESCLVLNEERVVLGRIRGAAIDGDPDALVEDVMESGPTTVRPNADVDALIERMRRRDVPSIVVTTSDGRLVGTFGLDAADAEGAVDAAEAEGGDEEASCLCE